MNIFFFFFNVKVAKTLAHVVQRCGCLIPERVLRCFEQPVLMKVVKNEIVPDHLSLSFPTKAFHDSVLPVIYRLI